MIVCDGLVWLKDPPICWDLAPLCVALLTDDGLHFVDRDMHLD